MRRLRSPISSSTLLISASAVAALLVLAGCAATDAGSKGACPAPLPTPAPAPLASATASPSPPPEAPSPSKGGEVARASGYDLPPQALLDVIRAPSMPQPMVSPTHDRLLLVAMEPYAPLARVAAPYLKLAGLRVEPKTRRKHDSAGGYGVSACAASLSLVTVATGEEVRILVPSGGCVDGPSWSPDGKHFTFRNTSAESVELWLGDAANGAAHRVPGVRLNPMMGMTTVQWMPDQKSLLVRQIPDGALPPPAEETAAEGPGIQESVGQKGQSSTYEARDTLKSKHDEALFDYYATSQLALVDAETGKVSPMGAPGIFFDIDPSPNGELVLVSKIHRPFSYVTTFDRFPRDVEIWDRSGKVVHEVAKLPLADRVPVHGVPVGPREFEWRANEPATLLWAEALDGGDWNSKVPARDKVLMQSAPFTAPPREVFRTEQRFEGVHWGEKSTIALVWERDVNRHRSRTFTWNPDTASAKPAVLFDRSYDESYGDPGQPVMEERPNGTWAMKQSGDAIFFSGQGASPEGDRPFVDRLDLTTKKTARLFRSDKTSLETFLDFTDEGGKGLLTWHQSPSDPPNAFARTLGDADPKAPEGEPAFASKSRAVTHIQDPTPAVRAIKKRLVKYKRKDGMDLSFTLYTPPNYQEGTRVPAILNAYPLDYADAKGAGQVRGSEQTFTRLRQYQLLLLAGYAIIDRAAFPVVGDPKKAYDHYLDQLTADAKAAVDKAVELGVVDPDRIGVTGHSHGALMTVNLLAHTDLFRAGVASSGAYNKTLTPFGFQNERRSVWDAPSVYRDVSPFFSADKIKLPLLLVHGDEDANPGTTPLQSRTLYEAIRGNGGTARLVMLPHEPHHYAAMESNEQFAYELLHWFDTYVKNAPPRKAAKK